MVQLIESSRRGAAGESAGHHRLFGFGSGYEANLHALLDMYGSAR